MKKCHSMFRPAILHNQNALHECADGNGSGFPAMKKKSVSAIWQTMQNLLNKGIVTGCNPVSIRDNFGWDISSRVASSVVVNPFCFRISRINSPT